MAFRSFQRTSVFRLPSWFGGRSVIYANGLFVEKDAAWRTSAHFLYSFFWVILQRLNFMCRHFGTLRLFHLHTAPMKMELKECSETSAHKIQTPGNHPKERIQHSEQFEIKNNSAHLLTSFSILSWFWSQLIVFSEWRKVNLSLSTPWRHIGGVEV